MKPAFLTHHQRLVLALLVGVVAVPITSTALFVNQEALSDDISVEDLRVKALEDRVRLRAQRRAYTNAIDEFQEKKAAGIDVVKPDINNPASVQDVFDAKAEEVHGSAPDTVSSLTTDQLETHDRALLRRYTRAGFCPDVLKNFYIDGFYQLCLALVGEGVKKEPVTGLLNHSAYIKRTLHGAPTDGLAGFKLRMKMIQQANDSTRRRDGGVLPGRPTVCVMNPDCLNPRYSD